jgi:cytochrome c oxidase subunit 4
MEHATSETKPDISHAGVDHSVGGGHVHVVPPKVLLGVYAALLVLTVLTVAVTAVNLGKLNIWLALGVAVAKAALVALYFMHLRWDAPFNGIVLIISLVFVAIFIGIAVMDSNEYRANYEAPQGANVQPSPG